MYLPIQRIWLQSTQWLILQATQINILTPIIIVSRETYIQIAVYYTQNKKQAK